MVVLIFETGSYDLAKNAQGEDLQWMARPARPGLRLRSESNEATVLENVRSYHRAGHAQITFFEGSLLNCSQSLIL